MNQGNVIDNMTSFELKVFSDYISTNDVLFDMKREEIIQIRNVCNKIITERVLQEPNIEGIVEQNYIKMVAEVVDQIRQESPIAKDIIEDIIKILNQYYGMVFSKIQMVQSTNGQLSSYDICLNYRNCKVAYEELDMILKQKQQLRNK